MTERRIPNCSGYVLTSHTWGRFYSDMYLSKCLLTGDVLIENGLVELSVNIIDPRDLYYPMYTPDGTIPYGLGSMIQDG